MSYYYGGIDPSASSKRASGCAILDQHGKWVQMRSCSTDEEMLNLFAAYPICLKGGNLLAIMN